MATIASYSASSPSSPLQRLRQRRVDLDEVDVVALQVSQRGITGAVAGASHLDALAARRAAVDGGLEEDVELLAQGTAHEVAEAVPADGRARHPEQLRPGHVGLQDAAVEGDHEIAAGRQQVEFVEVRLFLFVAQPLRADAAVELLPQVLVHLTPRCG
jgi:hypothetical protein